MGVILTSNEVNLFPAKHRFVKFVNLLIMFGISASPQKLRFNSTRSTKRKTSSGIRRITFREKFNRCSLVNSNTWFGTCLRPIAGVLNSYRSCFKVVSSTWFAYTWSYALKYAAKNSDLSPWISANSQRTRGEFALVIHAQTQAPVVGSDNDRILTILMNINQ